MSTRSGKRLHNASNENIEPEIALKSDRKTRSKRVVDNSESQAGKTTKKRQNYVSYPSEEDTADVNSQEAEVQVKPVHALRRQTLKEQNAATEEVDTAITTKKQVRSTRRTKKHSETAADDVPDVPVNEESVEVATVTNTKTKVKKNKKKSKKEQPEINDKENKVKVGKKKKNKKKKSSQSNSLVEQEEVSNVSTDSFHNAAGSPLHTHVIPRLNNNSVSKQPGDTETASAKRRSSLKRVSEQNISTKRMELDEVGAINIPEILTVRASKRRRSSLKIVPDILPDTAEKVDLNATFEKEPAKDVSSKKKRKSNVMEENNDGVIILINTSTNLDVPKTSEVLLNTTFEKDDMETDVKGVNNKKSDNKELTNDDQTSKNSNLSFEIRRSPRKSVSGSEKVAVLNGTFELSPKPELTKQKSLDSTYDKESKLDSTFDKTTRKQSLGSKSSLITSDDATNSSIVTLDKSDDNSKINITDDDSTTENILNTTPVLIESSMEESRVSVLESSLKENKTPETTPQPTTPLKREGTFTKDSPCASPKTPNKRQTLPAAGCTPYHSERKGSQRKRTLNQTHSIEKPSRRSSLLEVPTRATRVMFCSPVKNPGLATQRKSKIIKSNLKGSNKSFVFEEGDSVPSSVPTRLGRKRSFTHTDGEQASAKRTRLNTERSTPAARARTNSAMATPSKAATPKSEVKATKLPNFAALHARRFERMESLDECQQRKAKRAKQLLVPTGSVAVLERSSPRVTLEPKSRDSPTVPAAPSPAPAPAPSVTKPAAPAVAVAVTKPKPKLPTLDTLQPGYTRFGFKMNCDVNPFSVPKTDKSKEKPNGIKPNGLKALNVIKPVAVKREVTQPSLAGATSLRRTVAKQTIMREKSFTLTQKRSEMRNEVRTVIKGVRLNRRFDLQMKSRNLNG
ncbi:mucin-2-like isoform X2 [Cydia strobilella]|uniref:mucin-2-like isoform X2 n=1 Tax=Cydia strobilella TaxID=1100964 RepID=UPI00300485DC